VGRTQALIRKISGYFTSEADSPACEANSSLQQPANVNLGRSYTSVPICDFMVGTAARLSLPLLLIINIVKYILHPPAYEDGTDREFRNVGQ
jgi:hypothetical protein